MSRKRLAGQPATVSDVWRAFFYVRDAAVQVPADNVQAYADVILKLCDKPDLYDAKRAACQSAGEQFCDVDRSWMSALGSVLDQVRRVYVADDELGSLGMTN